MNLLRYFEDFHFEVSFTKIKIVCPLFRVDVDIESRKAEFVWIN